MNGADVTVRGAKISAASRESSAHFCRWNALIIMLPGLLIHTHTHTHRITHTYCMCTHIYRSKHARAEAVKTLMNQCTRVQTHQRNLADKWFMCLCVCVCMRVRCQENDNHCLRDKGCQYCHHCHHHDGSADIDLASLQSAKNRYYSKGRLQTPANIWGQNSQNLNLTSSVKWIGEINSGFNAKKTLHIIIYTIYIIYIVPILIFGALSVLWYIHFRGLPKP